MVNLCKIRWVLRLNALEVAVDLLPAVVESFHAIIAKPNVGTETSRKANGLLHAMRSFDFLIALVAIMKILGYTCSIAVSLQSSKINMDVAYQEVKNVIEALQHARDDAEIYHKPFLWGMLLVCYGHGPRRIDVAVSSTGTMWRLTC